MSRAAQAWFTGSTRGRGGRSYVALLLAAPLLAALAATGCGYSEDEMRARLREIKTLREQLDAESNANKRAERELSDARANIEQLKAQLKAAGINIANLNQSVEDQARALEEYKRRAAQLEAIRRRFELLRSKLQSLTKLGLKVVVRRNRMVIQLPGDVLFDSGRETLRRDGRDILKQVADVVRADTDLMKRDFQVAGHTDDRPYGAGIFKDNWGLSVMRAREVLAFLIQPTSKGGGGLDPLHWSASGYGDTDPIGPNDTEEQRQANRRCELVVVPNVEEMLDLNKLGEVDES